MADDLVTWLDGLFDAPATSPAPEHQQGRPDAALPVSAAPVGPADALALPWCTNEGAAVSGPLHAPGSGSAGPVPLLCRACRWLLSGRCGHDASAVAVPGDAMAARCHHFQPVGGVTIGRVWLWRVSLADGRLVWCSHLPEANQSEAIAAARAAYGSDVQAVAPLPGFDAFPE